MDYPLRSDRAQMTTALSPQTDTFPRVTRPTRARAGPRQPAASSLEGFAGEEQLGGSNL